jgi:sugar lactone lactonase YvrE
MEEGFLMTFFCKSALRLLRLGATMSLAWCGVEIGFCAGAKLDEPLPERVWPSPPDPARIAYKQSIFSPADAGVKVSTLGKLGNWITGGDKGKEPLAKPFGVALDEGDNLCVTDTGEPAVCYWDRGKQKWKRWTEIGKLRFMLPVAVTKHAGRFYVADSGLAEVVIFDTKPRVLSTVTNHLGRPSGVTIAKDVLFVADSQRHCVVRFTLAGDYVSEFGTRGAGDGQFNFPTHLSSDAKGRLFVTDSMNHRIQVFDATGRFVTSIGSAGDGLGRFSRPKGVATDSDGHVYVIDGLSDRLQIFNLEGQLLLNVGESGNGPGQFWLPNGVAISRRGEIFVADSYNRRLQVLTYLGSQ